MDTVNPFEPEVAVVTEIGRGILADWTDADSRQFIEGLRERGLNITENSPELVEAEWGDVPIGGSPMVGLE